MKDELIGDIIGEPISYTTSKWIIERVPFLFNNDFDSYINWKQKLSDLIGVDSKAIVFTGSSSVGFSLNPDNNLRPFSPESDVDVAIVSNYYFDISWFFLRNIGTRKYSFTQREKNAIEDHRKRLIYWGTIATDKIIQILPFGKEWIKSIEEMAKEKPTEGRQINFRIYKDFEALKAYHNNNLKLIKDKLITS
ncbi:hypothetical protein BH11BAC3_BH11BAC3_12080 [soil metagenome]